MDIGLMKPQNRKDKEVQSYIHQEWHNIAFKLWSKVFVDCSTKSWISKYRMGVNIFAGVIHTGLCVAYGHDTNISVEGSLKSLASAIQHAYTSICVCMCVKPFISGSMMYCNRELNLLEKSKSYF